MPALHRAIAFPEMHHIAVMIGEDLHFDMPRMLDVFFEVDARIAKGGLRFGLRLLNGRSSAPDRCGHAHAASAAAGRGLDQHRKANLAARCDRFASRR